MLMADTTTAAVTKRSEVKDVRVDVRDCRTARDVLEKAGFNFKVKLYPVFYRHPRTKKMEKVDTGDRAVVREDTGREIAVVGNRYCPIQAEDYLSRLDGQIQEKQLQPVSAVSFDFGRVMVVELALPQPIVLPAPQGSGRKEDVLLRRVLWRNSHDGTQQINLQDFLLRQWCTNGATHILGMSSNKVRHTSSADSRLKVAADAVAHSIQRFAVVEKQARLMLATNFSKPQMEAVAARLYPAREEDEISSRTEKARAQVVQLFEKGSGTFGRTAWDAINALTQWSTHERPVRGEGNADLSRLRTMWTVGDIRVRQGFQYVLEETGLVRRTN